MEKEYFEINGLVKVTEGSYKDQYFIVTEIDNSHPTLQLITCISLTHTDITKNRPDFKFDQLCAIQIGVLTKNKFKQHTHTTNTIMKNISTFRAIEGAVELEFTNDDGDIDATRQQQFEFLIKEFTEAEANSYLNEYEWDENGNCVG